MIDLDRIPPQSIESEQAVLGSILENNGCFILVSEILIPDDFYRSSHRTIYSAMCHLYEDGIKIDLITVSEKLRELRLLDDCGGGYYLTQLQESIATSANVLTYAETVKAHSRRREITKVLITGINNCFDLKSPDEILNEVSTYTVTSMRGAKNEITNRELLLDVMETIEEKKELSGIPTSIDKLDSTLLGWNEGLYIIAARPSHGKSAFMIQTVKHAAKNGFPCGVITLEMRPQKLMIRMLAAEIRADSSKIQGGLEPAQYANLAMKVGALEPLQIYYSQMFSCRARDIKAIARAWVKKYGIKLLAIDYLQLMIHEGENRVIAIGNTTRELKTLSAELNIPILLLSQLSRDNEKQKREPILADLRGSGDIEQDADVVLFIHNPEYDSENDSEVVRLLVRKNREGPTGGTKVLFLKKCTTFENMVHEIH